MKSKEIRIAAEKRKKELKIEDDWDEPSVGYRIIRKGAWYERL